jgi:predicted aconitase with swiveling domain
VRPFPHVAPLHAGYILSENPILAQGAALRDVPMLAGFDEDITAAIPNGAEVEVNPAPGTISVLG